MLHTTISFTIATGSRITWIRRAPHIAEKAKPAILDNNDAKKMDARMTVSKFSISGDGATFTPTSRSTTAQATIDAGSFVDPTAMATDLGGIVFVPGGAVVPKSSCTT